MDILLINPGKVRQGFVTEHLGIASLKAYLISQNFSAESLDMAVEALSVTDTVKKIQESEPLAIGVSLLEDSRERGLDLIRDLRRGGYKGSVIVGGYFATFAAREILQDFPEVDFVIRGEGELTLSELMETVFRSSEKSFSAIPGLTFRRNGKIVENAPRPLIADLDSLPRPDRKYAGQVIQQGGYLRLLGTRGCWGQCTFCDIISMYGISSGNKWRSRSIENLVDEIEYLVHSFHTNRFIFNDDQFLLKGKAGEERIQQFALELRRRNLKIEFELMCRADTVSRPVMEVLKSAGLRRVFLGLESFDEKQLQRFHKKITVRQNLKALITLYHLKIDVIASVILADAFTTLRDLVKQFIILYELRRRYFTSSECQISVNNKIEIYRGSRVFNEYREKGLLTENHYLGKTDYQLKFFTGLRLRLFELEGKISRIILKPGDVFQNIQYRLRWYANQIKHRLIYQE